MERLASLLLIVAISSALDAHAAQSDRRQQARLDEALRREGDAVVELAHAAMLGRQTPSDFTMEWRNDFLKAQPGTFVPFTIEIDSSIRATAGALMYLRVVQRAVDPSRRPSAPFAYESIFPIDVESAPSQPVRVRRGFAVPPGSYTLYAALRERPADFLKRSDGKRKAAVLVRQLEIPDFWTGELTTSTVILADRVEPLAAPLPPSELEDNPYVIGTTRVYPASAARFRREKELIVVFLIICKTSCD